MQRGILFLIDRVTIGGTEGQLRALVQGLSAGRFQPHLGTLSISDPDAGFPDLPGLSLSYRSFHHPSIFFCIWQLSNYVRRHRIRIVQTFFQDPTFLGALSKPFHPALLVGSFRDLGFWRNRRESFKMRLAYPAFAGFIANSKAVKEHFVNVDGVAADKIEIIHNGITGDVIPISDTPRTSQSHLLVGIVANLNRRVKRVDDFIRVAALVRDHCPAVRFVIVGDGELRQELESLSQSLGLAGLVQFAGRLRQPIDLVRTFAVGVNTSETEGFSNAVLEYMTCGIPVVATANNGNAEMISDGINGFLVPVGDVKLMAKRVVTLLQEGEMRQAMRSANVQLVRSCFSLEQMVRNHERYYDRLLGS